MDTKLQLYLNRQEKSQKQIIEKLRELILRNFPAIKETLMSEGLWYEGKFYITAFKDHVNLGVGIAGLADKEAGLFEGKGKTMRHIKFFSVSNINESKLLKLMTLINKRVKCNCKINWKN